MWRFWSVLAGTSIVLFALREVFHDLFHPSESGSLSDFVARRIFRLLRNYPKLLPDAGPLIIVIVIFSWAFLVCFGFALIYWPLLPGNFRIQSGRPAEGFWPMMYFSLEMMTTLGLGDYAPESTYLRMLATIEALVGFAILSASVSSVVLIHPALGRLRALARRVSVIARAGEAMSPSSIATDENTIMALTFDVARARVDLVNFPIIYYFYSSDAHASLPKALPHLITLVATGMEKQSPEATRLAATALSIALSDLAEIVARKFLRSEATAYEAVFSAYARDHVSEVA